MGKKRESKYKPGVGYVRNATEDLKKDSKKLFKDIKNIYEDSGLKKNIEETSLGNIRLGKYLNNRSNKGLRLSTNKMWILGTILGVLVISGVGILGIVLIVVLLVCLSIVR